MLAIKKDQVYPIKKQQKNIENLMKTIEKKEMHFI